MDCLVLSARKFPQEAIGALLKDLFWNFLELHDVPDESITPMQLLLSEELARIPSVISLRMESRGEEVWLILVGAGGQVVEKRLSFSLSGESPLRRPC